MKQNNFFKHFLIIGSGTFINMFIGLLTTPLITRIVDPVEYGKLSIFTMYSNIAVMVLCLGLDQALVRYYYDYKDEKQKKNLFFKCIIFPLIITLIASFIVIFCSFYHIIPFEFNTLIMVLMCIYTLIQVVYRFSTLIIRLEYKSKLFSLLSIISKIIYVGLAFALISYIKGDYLFLLIISTIISIFVSLLISICAQWNMWNFFSYRNSGQIVSIKELIKYSYPYIISLGVTTLFQAIDKISLNYYCDYAEVGIYASTMNLIHIFSLVQSTFNTIWAPLSVEHYTNHPKDTSFYVKANQVITLIMFFLGLSLILCKDLFAILLGEKYREAAYILPFLIFNPIMYTISETTVCGLVFKKKSNLQVIVAVGACVANIIGNVILVPIIGCKGAAISTGISYIIFFMLRTHLSNKVLFIDFKLGKFYLLTFLTCFYAIYNTFITFNFMSIVLYFFLLILMIIIYFDTIQWIINYAKNIFKKYRKS